MFPQNNIVLFLVISILSLSKSALVDILNKCSIRDNECLKGNYQLFIDTISNDGAPELGINKIDPLNIKDVSVAILNILNVTLLDGHIEGIKTCKIENFSSDIDKKPTKSMIHVICDNLVIQGNYEVEMYGPLLISAGFGDNLHGKGNGKVTINKVDLHLDLPFSVEKQDDGLHFKIETTDSLYTFDVLENASFEADNLTIGDKDASADIVKYMNENWKLLLKTFGKYFVDKAVEYIYSHTNKFLNTVPIEYFIKEDLSSQIKQ